MKLCEAFPGPTTPEQLWAGTEDEAGRAGEQLRSARAGRGLCPHLLTHQLLLLPAPEPALQAQHIASSGQGRRAAAAAASLMPGSNKMLQHRSAPHSSRVHKHRPHSPPVLSP